METKEIITIIGWVVSCALSVIAGGWLVPRLTKKTKILAWAVISESELITKNLHESLSLPVSIQIGGATHKSLSLVRIRLGNAGNEVIQKVSQAITFNAGASTIYMKPCGDLGEFQKSVEGVVEKDGVRIAFAHINPGSDYEFEMLLSEYEVGSVNVDVAAPGVELVRRDVARWEIPASALRSIGLNFFGIKYDPETAIMAMIAAELKSMRRMMQQREKGS